MNKKNNSFRGCKPKNIISVSELFTFSKQKFSNNYFFRGESHDFYEVVCVLRGKIGVTAGKNVYSLSAGQMTVHRPGEFHAIWEDSASRPESVIFSFSAAPFPKLRGYIYNLTPALLREIKSIYEEVTGVFEMRPWRRPPEAELKKMTDGSAAFDSIIVDSVREGMEGAAAVAVKRLEIFLLSALSLPGDAAETEPSGRGSENYTRILSVMEENIEKNLSVAELAAICKISVPTLEKTVFRYLHCGAMAYYNILRMNAAHGMLSAGASVKETALSLGFSNQNYFSACFKKRYGYPPSETPSANN